MQAKVTSKDFGYSVKFLKKNGYTFDAQSKAWEGSKDIGFLINEGYVVVVRQPSLLVNDCMIQRVEA